MNIDISLDDDWLEEIKSDLEITSDKEVLEAALTVLNWVNVKWKKNQVIVSCDLDGMNAEKLMGLGLNS